MKTVHELLEEFDKNQSQLIESEVIAQRYNSADAEIQSTDSEDEFNEIPLF